MKRMAGTAPFRDIEPDHAPKSLVERKRRGQEVPVARRPQRHVAQGQLGHGRLVEPHRPSPLDVSRPRPRAREDPPPLLDRSRRHLGRALRADAHDDLLGIELGGLDRAEQRGHAASQRALAAAERERHPILGRQVAGKLDLGLAARSVSDDPGMVRRAAHSAAHLRPDLEQIAVVIAPRHRHDGQELRRVRPRDPGEHLEVLGLDNALVPLAVGGLQPVPEPVECNELGAAVPSRQHGLLSREARSAIANTRPQELRADALVQAHALRDLGPRRRRPPRTRWRSR